MLYNRSTLCVISHKVRNLKVRHMSVTKLTTIQSIKLKFLVEHRWLSTLPRMNVQNGRRLMSRCAAPLSSCLILPSSRFVISISHASQFGIMLKYYIPIKISVSLVCVSNLMTLIAPKKFNGPISTYHGCVHVAFCYFNELLPLAAIASVVKIKELEQQNTAFILLALYGLL